MGELAVIPEAIPAVDLGLHDPEQFLASCDVRPSSRSSYERALRQFVAWVDENQVKSPTRADILQYKRYLLEEKPHQDGDGKGLSALTVSHYLVTVRRFFAWLEGEGKYPNVARDIKGTRRSRGFRKDKLTKAQILQLLASIDRTGLQGKRDFALVNLLIRTGLRVIEVIRADRGDIRQEDEEMVLDVQGKGHDVKDDYAVLTEKTLPPIMEYLSARGKVKDKDPLFVSVSGHNRGGRLTTRSVSRICKERLRDIGLDSSRLTAHSLRHTAITCAKKGGAGVLELQALGRHKDINTTMVYLHDGERIEHAAERNIDAFLAEG